MTTSYEVDRELGIIELRESFLEHTRRAYALLPPFEAGLLRILDIGCGWGASSLELARLSGGEVVGIDVDEAALEVMRERVLQAGLGDRVIARCGSFYEADFPDGSFGLLWEEGVLHLLDTGRCLAQCRRLLGPGCHLVMHETDIWFNGVQDHLADYGFVLTRVHPLPEHHWLTAYADPLAARLDAFEQSHDVERLDDAAAKAFSTHRAAVASIRTEPGATDSAFYIVRKRTSRPG